MAKVVLRLNECRKLEGISPADERAYQRFRTNLDGLGIGDTIGFDYKVPRSPRFHRRHFAMLGLIFDNQESFSDRTQFRKWTEVGAGHFDLVLDKNGVMFPLARSIDYESLDDSEFYEVHIGVVAFLRTLHASRQLWPHVSDLVAGNALDGLLGEFGT